ncbi:DUF1845 domain-containing protein [Thiorhodovibrio frisius]|uniref:Integrating conjugative element protein, PFL_4669 family n=1 Tax=Thiorhodovibrio frisius TaxID=631362 RepID=H8YWH9_9GAMM|nr:DUF1845 domain-containing protein [Thiorhodovibrio frisius]EIC22805.1 protein of unknown function (DUF1845) [Thiorhodovibrio frisius]WPL22938.1 hypothetical protein Thiofri_03116 [Thiorhodovibrio frisius]
MAQVSQTNKHSFSKPVLDQTVTIHSQNAQYVLQRGRSFVLVVRALYAISVVLRIIGDDDDMDQIEALVSERIGAVAQRLTDEQARLKQLADGEGGVPVPRYTNPREVTLQLSSPALAQYLRLIVRLDQTLMLLDGLWFAGLISNKQRKDLTHDLRRLVYGLGRELIDLERRARDSAVRRGQADALEEADGDANGANLVSGSLVDVDDDAKEAAARDSDGDADSTSADDTSAYASDDATHITSDD